MDDNDDGTLRQPTHIRNVYACARRKQQRYFAANSDDDRLRFVSWRHCGRTSSRERVCRRRDRPLTHCSHAQSATTLRPAASELWRERLRMSDWSWLCRASETVNAIRCRTTASRRRRVVADDRWERRAPSPPVSTLRRSRPRHTPPPGRHVATSPAPDGGGVPVPGLGGGG